jgi:rhamnose utilization protein RhaD (predicted bifunctional aldolase and dehydrogenase)
LVALSQAGSSAPLLVQGPGGNASIKSADGRFLYVKASGYRLSEVTSHAGYVTVDLPQAAAVLASSELARLDSEVAHGIAAAKIADAVAASCGLRASLETLFHTLFHRCVLHTHAVYANAFACMENGSGELERVLGESVCAVAYHTPGYALGRAVREAACAYARSHGEFPGTVLLENHVLITSGEDVASTLEATEKIIAAGRRYFGEIPREPSNPARDEVCEYWAADLAAAYAGRTGRAAVTSAVTVGALRRAAHDPLARLLGGHLCPDEAVFFQGGVRVCGPGVDTAAWLSHFEPPLRPRLVAVLPDRGVILLAPNTKALQAMEEGLTAHALVIELIRRRGSARTLAQKDADYLVSMEDEKYRQALTSGERTS